MIDGLVKCGFVERLYDKGDRRIVIVALTFKCNYEIIDGEFWALKVIRVSKHIQHILFNSSVLSVSKHW